jgi:hypothetical protein
MTHFSLTFVARARSIVPFSQLQYLLTYETSFVMARSMESQFRENHMRYGTVKQISVKNQNIGIRTWAAEPRTVLTAKSFGVYPSTMDFSTVNNEITSLLNGNHSANTLTFYCCPWICIPISIPFANDEARMLQLIILVAHGIHKQH